MNLKLITAVATECITKAEVKAHLRLDSTSFADDLSTTQSIAPGAHVVAASYSLVGTGVDILGYLALVNLESATNGAGGTVDVKIQESDDNVTYTDWSGGSFTQVTTANDNATYEKAYTGTKQYIRVVATVANATCDFAVTIVKDAATSVEDTQLDAWISAAREYGEDYTGHAFAPQTWELMLDDFPEEDYITIPLTPLTSLTSIKYKNSAGSETTATVTTDYLVDADNQPGKVFLPYGETWPDFTPYPYDAVRIRFVCGYTGTAPYILPKNYKQAMLMHIGAFYKYRDAEIPAELMNTINNLYRMRKIYQF